MADMKAYSILRQNNRFMWWLGLGCVAPMSGMLIVLIFLQILSVKLALMIFLALIFSTVIIVRMVRGRLDAVRRQITRIAPGEMKPDPVQPGPAHVIEQLIDSLPDPLIFLASDLRIIRANEASHNLSHLACPGRYLTEVFRQPELQSAARLALETQQPESIALTIRYRVEQKYLARLMPIQRKDQAGDGGVQAPALLLVLQDLTSQAHTERQRSDFIANVSHELRTPLTSLIGFIETLRGAARDDVHAREKFLKIMQDQSNRMLRLIEDLLSLSRIELDEHTKPDGEVHIRDVIYKVCDMLAHRAESRNIALNVGSMDEDILLKGDEDQLIQVFQNLIVNAIKYGDSDSRIDVDISCDIEGYLVISVADQGDGIDEEHLSRLTERFYRVDKARSRDVGGTGLGLAIVKHIVNRHRGRIQIESTLGKGSVFSVTLPKL